MRGLFVIPGKQNVSARLKNKLEDDFNILEGVHLLEGNEASRFLEYYNRFRELAHQPQNQDVVKIFAVRDGSILSFDISEILYFEVTGHEITAYGRERALYTFSMSMNELSELVEGQGFLRVHKCYMVSAKRVVKIRRGYLVLDNEKEITVGRSYLERVREYFQMKKMN